MIKVWSNVAIAAWHLILYGKIEAFASVYKMNEPTLDPFSLRIPHRNTRLAATIHYMKQVLWWDILTVDSGREGERLATYQLVAVGVLPRMPEWGKKHLERWLKMNYDTLDTLGTMSPKEGIFE